jgi:hypothetical protein
MSRLPGMWHAAHPYLLACSGSRGTVLNASVLLVACMQARDVERRKEQEVGAAILQQQLVERQAQRIREEELRDQVSTQTQSDCVIATNICVPARTACMDLAWMFHTPCTQQAHPPALHGG